MTHLYNANSTYNAISNVLYILINGLLPSLVCVVIMLIQRDKEQEKAKDFLKNNAKWLEKTFGPDTKSHSGKHQDATNV